MNNPLEFKITKKHLKLLKRMYVSWWDCEFGAPAIDCKRPYGNCHVYEDMSVILGLGQRDHEDEMHNTQEEINLMDRLHKEMQTVLQIGVVTGKFKKGTYQRTETYKKDWKLVKENKNAAT